MTVLGIQLAFWTPNVKLACSLLLILFMAIPFTSVAQGSNSDGYVVTNDNDTIYGTFAASKWNVTPSKVSFDGPNGREEYQPLDIKSFYAAGEFYESAIVAVDKSIANLQNLDYSSKPVLELDTMFIQALFRSSISLYHHKNEKGWNYFFIKNGDEPIEQLIYKKYLVDRMVGGLMKTFVVENNAFIGQMKTSFGQCPDLAADIDKARYQWYSLQGVFNKYAECTGELVLNQEGSKRLRTDFQVIVGLNRPAVRFYSDLPAFRAFTKGEFQTKIAPDFGVGVSFNSLRIDHLTANFFLLHTNLQVSGSHYDAFYSKTSNMAFRHSFTSGNLNFGISPFHSIPLYITLGGLIGFLYNIESIWEETYPSTPPRQRDFEFGQFESGFVASLGYQIKKVGVELMYERTGGFSGFANLGAPVSKFHLLMKYNIRSKEE